MSKYGTFNGKLRNVGSNTVNVGIVRVRFDICGCRSLATSLFFIIMKAQAAKDIHSIVMFAWLCMLRFTP